MASGGAGPSNSQPRRGEPTLSDILLEIRGMRGEMKQEITKVKSDVAHNSTEIQQMKDKHAGLEKENRSLQDKITQLQDHNRRNNLIVGGIPEAPGRETWDQTEEKVKHVLSEDLHLDQQAVSNLSIEKAHRLGRRKNDGSSRVIKVQFANWKDKDKVLRKARELRLERPYIREDYSAEVLDARSKLKPGLLAARADQLQAHLSHDKLIVQRGEHKNVYTYDMHSKEISTLSHTFEDNITWARNTGR